MTVYQLGPLPDGPVLDVRTVYSLVGNWSTPTPPVGQFFYIILMVVVVAFLAYYTTRLIGSAKYGRMGRRNLEIIESMGVGPQSFVHLLRVGQQYVLVGVSRGQVNLLSQVEEGKLKLPDEQYNSERGSFEAFLSRFQKKGEPEIPPSRLESSVQTEDRQNHVDPSDTGSPGSDER